MISRPEEARRADVRVEETAAAGEDALLRLSREIADGPSYGALVAALCRAARELVGADRVTLLRWDPAAGCLVVAAHDGMSSAEAESCPGPRLSTCPAPLEPAPHDAQAMRDGRLLLARLAHAGRTYGALAARRTRTPGPFGRREAALLEAAARQGGTALDRLRLAEDAGDAAALLGLARELDLAPDVPAMLDRLAAHALAATGAEAAVVVLRAAGASVCRVEATHGLPPDEAGRLRALRLGPEDCRAVGEPPRLPAGSPLRSPPGDGDERHVAAPLERAGETLGLLVLRWPGRDGAARHAALARGLAAQAAAALQARRLLEDRGEASRLKSEFVATMSHELRTPLNVIMGYNDLLLDGAFGDLAEEQRGVVVRMQRSAKDLLELVTAMLDLSRLEAGRSRVAVEPVAVPELLAQLEAETPAALEGKPIAVTWRLAAGLPTLETDRGKLRLVLKNVIGNAIKFTERGSVTIAADAAAGGVEFSVSDTGIGMRPEDVPVIFEMFRQVESANTRRHGGVGLGLYLVKRLLAELQGEVRVESRLGVGSTFRIRVPLRLTVPAGG